jgi:transposase
MRTDSNQEFDHAKKTATNVHQFKVQAVQLATQPGNTISQIARDLGIGSQTLGRWITQANQTDRPAFTGRGVQALTEQEKRIKDLERENAILRQEREIVLAPNQHLLDPNHAPSGRIASGLGRLKAAANFFLTPQQHLLDPNHAPSGRIASGLGRFMQETR